MKHIVYSSERVKLPAGAVRKSPTSFYAPVEGVNKVTIVGDYPAVERAYKGVDGVEITKVANARDLGPLPSRKGAQAEAAKTAK